MSSFTQYTKAFRIVLLSLLLLGVILPLSGQISVPGYYYLKKSGKKELNNDKPFTIDLSISNLSGGNTQSFSASKGNTFDFKGQERGLVRIRINVPLDGGKKLVVRKNCLENSSNLKLTGPYSLAGRDQSFSTDPTIEYQALENGPFRIQVVYDVFEDGLNPSDYDCLEHNFITFTGTVDGIVDPKKTPEPGPQTPVQPLDCAKEIANNKDNCERLRELIRTPSCNFEAAKAFVSYKNQLYTRCINENSRDACQTFYSCDPNDSRAGAVLRKMESLGDSGGNKVEDDASPYKTAWRAIENNADHKGFLEFLYQFPNSRYLPRALDSIAKYYPWSFSLLEKKGNTRIYQIDSIRFVKNLRWKDLSLGGGLQVNADNLPLDGRVELTFNELGDYLLYFEDIFGRGDSIAFSTQMKGVLKPGKDEYTVYIQGGTPPYQIELVDMGQNKVVKTYDAVQADSFAISMEDVGALEAPLLKVWIKDASQIRESVEGEISLVSPLNFQKISIYSLAILLSLLVVYLLYSFFRRRRLKNIQLQEA